MPRTGANPVDHVISQVSVRQMLLSLAIPLRLLLAAQPQLLRPLLQVVHRVLTRHLLDQAGVNPESVLFLPKRTQNSFSSVEFCI